jgi:hypothetical protein
MTLEDRHKFIIALYVLTAALALVIFKVIDQSTWGDVTKWVTGLYLAAQAVGKGAEIMTARYRMRAEKPPTV